MSALARWFKLNHLDVSGYDKTSSPVTDAIISEGIPVNFNDEYTCLYHRIFYADKHAKSRFK